ncbi:MAG: hypothetical protein GXO83_07505 [Chlorobi bacterium]|nr:hypothetical protein [Chlorobiota bacterium]
MDIKNIDSLLRLLDDPDKRVFEEVSSQLKGLGSGIIPELEKAWEISFNQVVQERLENIIEEIQVSETRQILTNWLEKGAKNAFTGAFYIARLQYPDLEFSHLDETVEKIRKDVWLEFNDQLTALEKVRLINHILFDVYGFKPNRTNFYAPQNNYINIAMDSRMGNPVSLSLIYQEVSHRLSLPVHGVLLPGQFILAYIDPYIDKPPEMIKADDILFYIHPFNRGSVLGKKEIDEYLKEQGVEASEIYYLPCKPVQIVTRIVSNLVFAYNKLGYPEKVEQYKDLLNILKSKRNG